MIPIGSLQGDYYMLDEDNYQVIGRRYGKCYKLGYPVNIRVKRVDMLKKQRDFDLVEETDTPAPEPQRQKTKEKRGRNSTSTKAPKNKKKSK